MGRAAMPAPFPWRRACLASNPRIEDLRRRLDREPGSRLFAQLAEELRKDGDLEEAIRVSREGLHKHPAYPSARMTLGRALLDTGDLAAARTEFEIVLKGAPDNILASRFLGECLEGLGDLTGARERFKATLALSPGDKVVTAHLQEVEAKLKKVAPAGAAPAATGISRGHEDPAVAPIPLSRVDELMELERPAEARTIASRPEPEQSPEAEPPSPPPPPAIAAPVPPPPIPIPPPKPREREAIPQSEARPLHSGAPEVPERAVPAAPPLPPPVFAPTPPPPAPPRMDIVPAPADELTSSTLAELYFNQGFTDKAIEV